MSNLKLKLDDGSTVTIPAGTDGSFCISCLTVLLVGLIKEPHVVATTCLDETTDIGAAVYHLRQQYTEHINQLAETEPANKHPL